MDRVFASIEELVHGNTDQSNASFILGTILQMHTIENTVNKRQAIGSRRFCGSDEQFQSAVGQTWQSQARQICRIILPY
jgi:hypothetical protein